MTIQVEDTVLFHGKEFALVSTSNGKLFKPRQYGYIPGNTINTACHRGYFCTYEVKKSQLFLKNFYLNLDSYPMSLKERYRCPIPLPLNGVVATRSSNSFSCPWSFRDLKLSLAYSGELVIGVDFTTPTMDDRESINTGPFLYQKYSKSLSNYQEVHKLIFSSGELIDVRVANGTP